MIIFWLVHWYSLCGLARALPALSRMEGGDPAVMGEGEGEGGGGPNGVQQTQWKPSHLV
jgi:hypothetical protein